VHPAVTIDAFVRFAGSQTRLSDEDRTDPRIDPDGTDAWFTLNAGIEWWVHPAVTVRLGVENILDRAYREHGSGIDAPGINGIAALDVRF
jgi:outer membrane receptor protein involved in Fe transport